MRIIRETPDSNGAYPAIQQWPDVIPPTGYAIWPDTLSTEDFDTYNGFVVLTIARHAVISYEVNHEAWEAWQPAPEPDPPTPSGGGADQVYAEIAEAIRGGVNSI